MLELQHLFSDLHNEKLAVMGMHSWATLKEKENTFFTLNSTVERGFVNLHWDLFAPSF